MLLPGHKTLATRLKEAGLEQFVEVIGGKGGRTDSVRFTDAGDEHARALCGLPTLGDGLAVASRIEDFRTDPRGTDERGFAWAPEDALAGVTEQHYSDGFLNDEGVELLARLQFELLPCLWRGLVLSACDVQRHTWYAVRPSRVKSYRAQNYPPVELPAASDEAWDIYGDVIKIARGTLYRSTPTDLNCIGDVPFSCSPNRRGSVAA